MKLLTNLLLPTAVAAVAVSKPRQLPPPVDPSTQIVAFAGYSAPECGSSPDIPGISFAWEVPYSDRGECLSFPFGVRSVRLVDAIQEAGELVCHLIVYNVQDCEGVHAEYFETELYEPETCVTIPERGGVLQSGKVVCVEPRDG